MNTKSNLNLKGTAKTFIMPQITNELEKELLAMANFPQMVKPNECLQRRIKKYKTAKIWVEKQIVGLDDVVYTKVPLNVAAIELSHELTPPANAQEAKIQSEHAEKLKASKTHDVIYLSSDDVQSELDWFLGKFGVPKATESMKVKEVVEDPFTDAQKEQAKEMFTTKSMTDSEIAETLDVKKSLVTKYLKTLKNG